MNVQNNLGGKSRPKNTLNSTKLKMIEKRNKIQIDLLPFKFEFVLSEEQRDVANNYNLMKISELSRCVDSL